jgi:triosephosphate isomerase
MLKSVKCDYVIIGHSERKRLFGEDEKTINKKLKAALAAKLGPLLFFGEEEKLAIEGARQEILRQLRISLAGLDKKALSKIIFVYEPAYAISTQDGQVLTSKEIEEKISFSRKTLGEKAVVLYGGSVDESNIKEYLGKPNIDGVVIGQASLDPKQVKKIISQVVA